MEHSPNPNPKGVFVRRHDAWTFDHDVTLVTNYCIDPESIEGWASRPIAGREHLAARGAPDLTNLARARLNRIRESILWHGERVRREGALVIARNYLIEVYTAARCDPQTLILPPLGAIIGQPRHAVLAIALRHLSMHANTIVDAVSCPHTHPEIIVKKGKHDGSEVAAITARLKRTDADHAPVEAPLRVVLPTPSNVTPFPREPLSSAFASALDAIDRAVEERLAGWADLVARVENIEDALRSFALGLRDKGLVE